MPTDRFEFFSVPRIVFGRGAVARVEEIARPFGPRALVIFNGNAWTDDLSNGPFSMFGRLGFRQHGEPTVESIDDALTSAREFEADFIVGLGGGSAIDAAKAVAGLLTNGGSALDYMEVIGAGKKLAAPAAPWIAIPTTAGTGAEVTRNSVVGSPEHHFKASIRGEQLLARAAIIDPELGVNVPPHVTASSGMDALCQLIESYTSTGAQPMTDALAMQGIPLAARSLRRAFENGSDVAARSDMALAAMLSGITLGNAGLGAAHGFAAPLGANFTVPHGTVCAALLPHVMAENVRALRAAGADHPVLSRYATIGRLLGRSGEASIESAVQWVSQITQDLRIPPLGQFGLKDSDIPAMAQLARKASSMRFNPVELSDDALARILEGGISGRAPTAV